MVAQIPSSNKIDQWKFETGMFVNLQAGSLLVVDCGMLENLRDAAARAEVMAPSDSADWCCLVTQEP